MADDNDVICWLMCWLFCSAGLGRSGTFIAIDMGSQQVMCVCVESMSVYRSKGVIHIHTKLGGGGGGGGAFISVT